MSRSLADLHPWLQARAESAITEMRENEELRKLGCETIAVSETKRDLVQQMAYYACGRMEVKDVRRMYAAAGLYDIGPDEAKQIKTNTLSSKHLEGKAIDLVPVHNGKYWWSAPAEVWEIIGTIGENHGMKWGGRWKDLNDSPHFEI